MASAKERRNNSLAVLEHMAKNMLQMQKYFIKKCAIFAL